MKIAQVLLLACTLIACRSKHTIDTQYIAAADQHPGEWVTHGLNYSEDRFSKLDAINASNIKDLGIAWTLELDSKRGLEATPLVADGVMYFTGVWSIVYAVDAKTGQLLWQYDPKVPPQQAERLCCDIVNRGVALYEGKVFVGTLDGRLIALNMTDGSKVWEVQTVDPAKPYSITGAPRVIDGKVIIGNGGAELGVRGYISAYDANTSKLVWRFYTVPGNPSKPFENEAMEKAAPTWAGRWWEYGGGGTAWDAMAYDPDLHLLYVGTGNGSPWDRKHRSNGFGDNLYLSSILALDPSTGKLQWYYQTTPGDSWDFTATQHIILADLKINGTPRKVLMQAPKNGFFYVLDRTNGQLLSADPFVYTNWAKSVDLKTGRPVEEEGVHYETVNTDISPNYNGGHNWHPMAFNPTLNLVFIPARENVSNYGHDPEWIYNKRGFGTGAGWNLAIGTDPKNPTRTDTATRKFPRGFLMAWDPVQKKEIWRVPQQADWNGGVLTTASGLVFQGMAQGDFIAYNGKDGKELWKKNLGGGIIAPPITYAIDGKQYVSVLVGWGGGYGMKKKFTPLQPGRLFTFCLGGTASMPSFTKEAARSIPTATFTATPQEIKEGETLFWKYCGTCHVVAEGGGLAPDLGYSPIPTTSETFANVVIGGALLKNGMPQFKGRLDSVALESIRKFVLTKAQSSLK